MAPSELILLLQSRFGSAIIQSHDRDLHPRIHVQAGDWRAIAEYLFHTPELRMNWLANLTGIDYAADNKLCTLYDLWSFEHRHALGVKVFCDRENPHIPTVCDLWSIANWHEREAYDLFGIIFDGHPNLSRILLADDWVGHPLRKDYAFPTEYHGIPGSVEAVWNKPQS